jgi:hypothetical protein
MAKAVALTGGAYQARSVVASAQRSLNLYAEPMPRDQGEPAPVAHYPTPGTIYLTTIDVGPIRGIRQASNGAIYVVSASNVYNVDPGTWVPHWIGSITANLTTPVSMADNGLDLIIVDGSANGWDVNLAANTMSQIVDPNGMFGGADRVDYLDTFFLFNKPGTPQFYWSGSLATTFDTLDFANKESASDYLVTLIVARREIYLIGQKTTEIWYDAGATFSTTDTTAATSSQFQSVQGVFIDHGIVAKYSIARYDNAIFWLARNRQGDGVVMTSAGYRTDRISTYAIETALRDYVRIDDAIGWTYQINGHAFYVLTFPAADHTWVYDTGTKLWHEWGWIDTNGAEHRHRANAFATVNGQLVVGDYQNGSLYALSTDVYTDQNAAVTGPIKRQRSFPHIVETGRRMFWREFIADMETGTAPKQGPVPANLLVSLDWSSDRGHSYGSPVTQAIGGRSPTLGAGGDYLTSMQWQRCGMSRDRVWRLSWTVNAPTVLQGAWVRAEVADADAPAPAAAQG